MLKISFFWLKTNIKASYSWLKSCQSQVEMADQDLRSFKLMGSWVWDVICLHDLRLIKMFKKILKMKNSVFVLFCLILNLKKNAELKKISICITSGYFKTKNTVVLRQSVKDSEKCENFSLSMFKQKNRFVDTLIISSYNNKWIQILQPT